MATTVPPAAPAHTGVTKTSLVVLLFVGLTLLFSMPLSLHPMSFRLPTGPDGDLCMWILAWDTHAFTSQPLSIFDANIYFPQHLTLAYAENLIGSAIFAAPVLWLTGNLTLASNFVGFFSCTLCGLGAYVLARRLGISLAGSILTGLIFAFSPSRFFRIGQLHLTAVQWIPFGLASLYAYFDNGRKRDLRLAAAFFSLQALSSGYGAVFMSLATIGLLAYRTALGEPIRLIRRIRDLGLTGLLLLVPTALVFLPYRAVQREVGLRRGLGGWGVDPASFIASPSHFQHALLSAIGAESVYQKASAFLFPGFLPIALAAVALFSHRASSMAGTALYEEPAPSRPARHAGSSERTPARSRPEIPGTPKAGPRPPVQTPGHPVARTSEPVPPAESVRPGWRMAAVLVDVVVVGLAGLALYVDANGPVKLRLEHTVLFSARDATRPWIAAALMLVIRVAMLHGAPFTGVSHLRRGLAATLRLLALAGRVVWRSAKDLAGLVGLAARRIGWGVRRFLAGIRAAVEPVRRFAQTVDTAIEPVRRRLGPIRTDARLFFALLTLVSFWLAMGPPYGLWQFVYNIPGFTFIRECSRFAIVGLLGVAILAGFGFERLADRKTPRRRAGMAIAFGVLLIGEFASMPLAVQPTTAVVPEIDRWLDTQPKPFVVAEVPTPLPSELGPFERRQAAFMIHSTAHWQKTVHGYSGWRTPLHESLYWDMLDFPNEKLLDTLAGLGVTHVVVHTELYPPGEWDTVSRRIEALGSSLRLEHVAGEGRAYTLHRPSHQE